ncbi:hypothetical protein AC1031_021915 [Aphanomyces cochlioides]|nr:hypothetical protein AC1031_021915 [Aphanomyces cochlioides]
MTAYSQVSVFVGGNLHCGPSESTWDLDLATKVCNASVMTTSTANITVVVNRGAQLALGDSQGTEDRRRWLLICFINPVTEPLEVYSRFRELLSGMPLSLYDSPTCCVPLFLVSMHRKLEGIRRDRYEIVRLMTEESRRTCNRNV